MRKLTFEKILAAYMALAAVLALLLPSHFAIEHYAPINPSLIPLASWLRLTPGALPFLTTYFFSLTCLLPLVVVLLARHPQDKAMSPYQVPTLGRCIGATLIAIAVAGFMAVVMYSHITLDGTESSRGAIILYAAAVSRIGLTAAGPMVMGTIALVVYIAFVKVPRMWLGFRAGTFG